MVAIGSQFARVGGIRDDYGAGVNKDPSTRTVVRRIRNIYEATPDDVREAGLNWYPKVHDASAKGAREFGRSTRQAAGVVSAVSPNMDWDNNNIDALEHLSRLDRRDWSAIEASANRPKGEKRHPEVVSMLQEKAPSVVSANDGNLMKAHRIWNLGEDPESVLDRKTAPKTHSFFQNINNPDNPNFVTVDGRHADIIADAMRPWKQGRGISSGSSTRGRTRYENYEDATARAARSAGITPSQMQAVVWEHGKQIERGYSDRPQGPQRMGQSYQRRMSEFRSGGSL